MSTRVRKPGSSTARVQIRSLRERHEQSASRLDEERGVLHGVKVLGLQSINQRRYLPECLQEAASLYQGVSVRVNHPEKHQQNRDVNDVFGWLENVRYVPNKGLFADLHYLKNHSFAPRLVEAARRNPRLLGLSHNADGETAIEGDVEIVQRITEVKSVDLVADPATTQGLFESQERGKRTMKLREWFDQVKLLRPARNRLTRLLESMDMGEEDMPLKEDDTGALPEPAAMDPEEALKQGFRTMMIATLDDESLSEGDMLSRLKQLVKARNGLVGTPAGTGEAPAETDLATEAMAEEIEEIPDKKHPEEEEQIQEQAADPEKAEEDEECPLKMKESANLKARLRLLEAEKSIRELCDELNYKPGKVLMEALLRLPNKEKRRELLLEQKTERPVRRVAQTQQGNSKDVIRDVADTDSFVRAITC